MLRRAVLGALAALVLAVPAGTQPKLLMPGVTYDKQVQFTLHGPAVMHVLTTPRPGGLWTLEPVLANEAIVGTERVTAMQSRLAAWSTSAGVNGDRFSSNGRPSGLLIRDGVLDNAPSNNRSSIGLEASGGLRVEKLRLLSTWQGAGQRQTLSALNNSPSSSGTSLYTPVWGPVTPVAPGAVELVLRPFARSTPNTEISGPVVDVRDGGGTAIPPDGAVLVARGAVAVRRVRAEAPPGTIVRVRLILDPDWAGVGEAIGGGPALVRGGKAIFDAKEAFVPSQLALSDPRTAIGQLADGRIVLVVVDGRQAGYSTGMTNFELALALVRLGAVTAAALDGGGSSTMAFEGQLLNRPSGGSERAVADGLFVTYAGIQAPVPAVATVSPNGDGIAEAQSLAFKVVRQSNVTAQLIGPDGGARTLLSGGAGPGTYPFTWAGETTDGAREPEGAWRWVVSALDDLGRASSFERPFALNNTLGFPRAVNSALPVPRRVPRAVAQFTLARAASVTSRIETVNGTVIRSPGPAVTLQPGTAEATWDGRTDRGAVVHAGTYVARLTARNEVGSVSMTAKFAVRRTSAGTSSR